MGDINLEVWDATGNKRIHVRVPDDVAVERILMVLADKLHLPRFAPDGQLMSYKFHHRRLGVQLLDDRSLALQHVQDADIVRIQPEITAGGRHATRDQQSMVSMASADSHVLDAREDRYHRQTLIEWWDQRRVRETRILVIGAGALGNEVLKLLALIGNGWTLVYDPDRIERSNLSRSVLFRESDEGQYKAAIAVQRMHEINPDVRGHARCDNVLAHAGLGVFLWADVVIGAVDNREARVFINSACARTRRTWVDGAIENLSGIVRVFTPHDDSCYECTMNSTDRKLLAERRSCALLARDAVTRGHVPTSAVAASIVGAMEVQEAFKLVHGQPALAGSGIHLDGLYGQFSRITYPRRPDCLGHEDLGTIIPLGLGVADVTLGELLERAESTLGPGASLDLSRDLIIRLSCATCGGTELGKAVLGTMRESQAACLRCGTHRAVEIASSIGRDSMIDLALTPADIGIPPFDVIVARQGTERQEAWLFDGDAGAVLGPLAASYPGI